MTGFGLFLIVSAAPCIGLGIYFRRQPPKATGGKKKAKKKGKQEDERAPAPEGGSLIWGGALIALAGAGLIVADLMK